MEKIEVKLAEGVQQLVIREGSALPVREPLTVNIDGTIQAPAEYLAKRTGLFDAKKSNVLFSYEKMYIKLTVSENDPYTTTITGKLIVNPELLQFGINSKKTWTKSELKTFLKMNRSFFKNIDENFNIVTNLEKFTANVQAQIDDHNDNRGNSKKNAEVKVDTTLAMNFVLFMPIFLGQPSRSFQVEICFDVRDNGLSIWLESPELQELIIIERQALIDANVEPFRKEFVVIQQ